MIIQSWFEKRRFNRALRHLDKHGEMTYPEIIKIASPRDSMSFIFAIGTEIYNGNVKVRYDRVVNGKVVESASRLSDLSNLTIPSEITVVYMKVDKNETHG